MLVECALVCLLPLCPRAQSAEPPDSGLGVPTALVQEEKKPESDPFPVRRTDRSGMSFYPLPAFSADKDAGLSAGVLVGLVFTDERGIQNALLSLSAGYQHLVRWNGEAEYRYSPDDWSLVDLDGFIAQRVENSLRLFYEDVNAL